MSIFEALTAAFATAGTGGFSVTSSGMAYGPYIQIVVTVFMLLFSVNFTSYYLLLRGKPKDAWTAEVRTFIIIVLSAIVLIACNVHFAGDFEGKGGFGDTLRQTAFYVASIISTTGFGIEVDFSLWPQFSIGILVLLMFVGACAGSTGGGMKVSRWMILSKGGAHEVGRLIHPKQVKKITMDGRVVEHEVVRSVNAYLVAFILIFVTSLLLISFDPLVQGDFTTAFTSVATTLNNIGPGVGPVIGPTGSFTNFTVFSKIVYIFDMLAGRLEVFPMLVLFAPSTWRK
jgi:trk system potassium uptake protein TrkH